MKVKYKSGYKYQLVRYYRLKTDIKGRNIETYYISLNPEGLLSIKKGYAWDGPSGPTIDTKNSMRGALVHDALYQLMREGLLPEDQRGIADKLLRDICIEDGMYGWRANLWYAAVRKFAGFAAEPDNAKEIITAP